MILYTPQYITGRLWARLAGRYSQARQSAAAAVRDELLTAEGKIPALCYRVVAVTVTTHLTQTLQLADTTDSNQAKEGLEAESGAVHPWQDYRAGTVQLAAEDN